MNPEIDSHQLERQKTRGQTAQGNADEWEMLRGDMSLCC